MRDGHSRLAQRTERADGHRVVGGKDRRGPMLELQQIDCRSMARFFTEVAVQFEKRGGADRVAVSAQSLAGVSVLLRTLDEGDSAVTDAEEMLHHRNGAPVVVDGDRPGRAG